LSGSTAATSARRRISGWHDARDDERPVAGNRAFAAAMRPFGTGGAYLNFTPERDRVRAAYGARKYERLVALKQTYDPDNLFRLKSEHHAEQVGVVSSRPRAPGRRDALGRFARSSGNGGS
jgi:hypothetical protein